MDLIPTPSQTAGPFFHLGCTDSRSVGNLAGPGVPGERIRLLCRVLDGDGVPINDAMVEIWQADGEGRYCHTKDDQEKAVVSGSVDSQFRGFGRLATDDSGTCVFTTIKPGRVAAEENRGQAPHINVSVFARGVLKRLATRIYFAGDPANESDPIMGLVPASRRDTLLARAASDNGAEWRFDIRLGGGQETVFFDV